MADRKRESIVCCRTVLVRALCIVVILFGSTLTSAQEPQHNHFKKRLIQGKAAVGTHLSLSSPKATEIVARAGFDWLFVDLENTAADPETLQRIIGATKDADAAVIVRLAGEDQWLAKPVLDMGAMGAVMPAIRTREDAARAVAAVRYPPQGIRGIGPTAAARHWGISVLDYLKVANDEILAMILIEHIEAANNIDEILTVPGIDTILVGAGDLAASMGLLGQSTHPRVEAVIQKIHAAAKKSGVPTGALAYSPEDANRRIAQGFQAILMSHDVAFLKAGAEGVVEKIER